MGNVNSGAVGGIGAALGTNSTFQAQQAPAVNSSWSTGAGPSADELANGTSQFLGQSNTIGAQVQGADRVAQGGYLQSLAGYGSGTGAAQGMLQQGTNAANASALSLARSSGGNAAQQAAALRGAQQQQATNITGAGAQAAQLQAQQQQAALGMQGNVLAGQQAADLQQQQLYGAQGNSYLGAQMNAGIADLGAQQSNNAINSTNYNAAQGLNQNTANQNAQSNTQLLGAGASAAGSLMAMSDMRAKTNIADADAVSEGTKARYLSDENAKDARSPGTNAADQFLATLKPYTYEYKSPKDEPSTHGGRYLGIMTQNVERGPTGQTLVTDTPRGKAIEGAASIGAALAGIGRLHERLSALETMRGARG